MGRKDPYAMPLGSGLFDVIVKRTDARPGCIVHNLQHDQVNMVIGWLRKGGKSHGQGETRQR